MTIKLTVPDMACGTCATNITEAIQQLDDQATVQTDLETKQVVIASTASESSLKEAIAAAGYSLG
ncbi:MAG: heavy-metal-associated domain-containing protein [Waterburya sp.]